MIRVIASIAFIVITTCKAVSFSAEGGSQGFTRSERGMFSVGFFGGYSQDRMLNQDGSYAGYKGYLYGASIDIQLWSSGIGEFRVFGELLTATNHGTADKEDKSIHNESIYGLKIYANPNLFLAGAMGSLAQKVTVATSENEAQIANKITALGLGFDYPIADRWLVSLQGWYKSGPIIQNENPTLSSHSFYQSGEVHLMFVWSPPMTIINYTK